MRKTTLFMLFYFLILLFSCSTENLEISPENNKVNGIQFPATMTKNDFIQLVKDDCSAEELTFLEALPDTIEIYVYPAARKSYTKLMAKESETILKILNKEAGSFEVNFQEGKKEIKPFRISRLKSSRENVQNVYRSMNVTVTYFSSNIWGYVSAALDATLNYEYDLVSHTVIRAESIICDINSRGVSIDGLVFDWNDKGSRLNAMSDGQGLIYSVSGDVILGKAFGDYAAGFVCEQIRGRSGETLVPWE